MPEGFEPEIERQMTIEPLIVPKFEAHLREGDLVDLDRRDRRMILALSLMEQKQDFVIAQLVAMNCQLREIEAEQIRQKKSQTEINWRFELFKWASITAAAALLAAALKRGIDQLWP